MQAKFSDEVKLLGRVIYKNKNQHRRLLYFQFLQMAYRKLRALEAAVARQAVLKQECLEMLNKAKFGRDIDLELFQRTLDAIVHAGNLHPIASKYCVLAAEKLSALVAKGWFMTFAVVTLASVSAAEAHCGLVGNTSDSGKTGAAAMALQFQEMATLGLRRMRNVCTQPQQQPHQQQSSSAATPAVSHADMAVRITRIVLQARQQLSSQVVDQVRAYKQQRKSLSAAASANSAAAAAAGSSSKKRAAAASQDSLLADFGEVVARPASAPPSTANNNNNSKRPKLG